MGSIRLRAWQRVLAVSCLTCLLLADSAFAQQRRIPSWSGKTGKKEENGRDQASSSSSSSSSSSFHILEPVNGSVVDCLTISIIVGRNSSSPPPHGYSPTVFMVFVDGGYAITASYPPAQEFLAISLFPQRPGAHHIALRAYREDLAAKTVHVGPELSQVHVISTCQNTTNSRPFSEAIQQSEGARFFLHAQVPPCAFNPLAPQLRILHSPAVLRFEMRRGEFDSRMHLDWLGVKTNTSFDDCEITGSYFAVQPSRYFPCVHHKKLSWDKQPGEIIDGFMPVIDDEYPQLLAALNAALASDGKRFVVFELGAWYGPWAMRAAAAFKQLHSDGDLLLLGVDPDILRVRQMKAHWEHNGVRSDQYRAIQAFVGSETSRRQGVEVLSLSDLFRASDYPVVDYLDIDVQSSELDLLSGGGAREILRQRVRRVQVGTHSSSLHLQVRRLLEEEGFKIDQDYPYNPQTSWCDRFVRSSTQTKQECLFSSSFGPMYVRDGLLSAVNSNQEVWPAGSMPQSVI